MKILIVNDKKDSAIDRISKMIQQLLPHLSIDVLNVHPKRPSAEDILNFKDLAQDADILDFEYWKTAEMLREKCPEAFHGKPTMLAQAGQTFCKASFKTM